MIGLILVALAGLAAVVVSAIAIGIMDARQNVAWRRIAAERRRSWERKQRQLHGSRHTDSWGDEDTD